MTRFYNLNTLPVLIVFLVLKGQAQFYNLPSDYFLSLNKENPLLNSDSIGHFSLKPYLPGFQYTMSHSADSLLYIRSKKHVAIFNALFNDHLLKFQSKHEALDFFIDPLLNFEYGKDLKDPSGEKLFTNTRGIIAGGHLGPKVYFETMVSENQSTFVSYIDTFAIAKDVIPGQGRWKVFKTNGYDYAFSSGFVSVHVNRHFDLQFGHGKHKIGNGYRSLFISDNAFNYPFARLSQQWFRGRLQYTNLYTVFMNLKPALDNPSPGTEALYQKKAASFQYLSLCLGKSVQLGFFQGLMWAPGDGRNQQHLDFNYFNPVIYANLFNYGLSNNNHNLLIGTELQVKVTRNLDFYGQFMADDFNPQQMDSKEGLGYQLGLKYFDALGVKGLFIQTELNKSGKAAYNSFNGVGFTPYYNHYNQNLATAFANGEELLVIASYTYKRFFVNARYHYQLKEETNQNSAYTTQILCGKLGYLINPTYNLNLYLGINSRLQKFNNFSQTNFETNYISFGIKTGIYNLYYDF